MKIGIIAHPNSKGQIVIPKSFRDALGINSSVSLNLILSGKGIVIYPIQEIMGSIDQEDSYLHILKKTKGSWATEDWSSLRKKRKKIELFASKKRKKQW